MFENGLVKEVEDLFTNPETWEYTSFQGIGYKEFKDYFLKEKSIDEVKTAIKHILDNMRKDNIHGLRIRCLYIGLKHRIEMKYIVQ